MNVGDDDCKLNELRGRKISAIVIGASAGAVDTLSILLANLSSTMQLPVIIVVHVPSQRENLLPLLFSSKSHLEVREIEDKEPIEKGKVYVAPPNYHVLVEVNRCLSLSCDPPVLYSRPSIDVLFESAADVYREELIGVVLTGANSDGAEGLHSIVKAGGIALVQDPKESYAAMMPAAALAKCPTALSLPVVHISKLISELAADS